MIEQAKGLATEALRLVVWLALLTAIFVPIERAFALRRERFVRQNFWTDLGYYFLSGLLPSVALAVLLAPVAAFAHTVVPAPFHAWVASLPLWALLPVALVIGDIGAYWGHRISHAVPALWRFHRIHHAAPHIDFLVNTRAHPVDLVVTRMFGLVPLYVLGLAQPVGASGTLIPALVAVIGTLWSFFVHANVRWRFGLIERVVATPFFHHWHHTHSDHIDRNFAAMFPWIDRLFGTQHLPADWPQRYGITAPIPATLAGQLLDPFGLGERRPAAAAPAE